MEDGTHLRGRIFRLLACLCAGLTVTVAGSGVRSPDGDTLWAAGRGAALAVDTATGEVHSDIPMDGKAHAVAVDRANSRVWLQIGSREVTAYDPDGQRQFSVRTPKPLAAERRLEVDPVTGDVWLADRSHIYRIRAGDGIVLHRERPASERITGATLDPARSRFWYATRDGLTALWPNGETVQRVPLSGRGRSGDPRIAYDGELDRLWVADGRRLARYDAGGTRTFVTGMPVSATALAPDGRGGLWLASHNELRHIDRSGLVEFTLRPFSGRANLRGGPQTLAADPETGGVWVAGRMRLRHYGLDGRVRHTVDARAPDGGRHPLADAALPRRIPIEIVIESPGDGALIDDNMPPVAIRVEGPGEIGSADVALNANGEEIPRVCERLDAELHRCTPTTPLPEGGNELTAHARNAAGTRFDSEPVAFTVDTVPPDIEITHPPRGFITNEPALTVAGEIDEPAGLTLNGEAVALDPGLGFALPLTLAEGENTLKFRATDLAGNVNTTTRRPLLDTEPPAAPQTELIDGGEAEDGYTTVSGKAGSVEPNAVIEITNTRTGATITARANEDGAFTAEIEAEPGDEFTIVARDAAGNQSETGTTTARGPGIPPDPEDVAPPLPAGGSPPLAERVGFLYQGDNPIQQGVAPETIDERRVAVLRGEVRDRAGDPLPGVRIAILDRPELGWTHTQFDGGFDMAVNGGGALTVVYEKDGYLPVQRTVGTRWNDWYHADDVVMVPLDDKVTAIDLTDDSQPFQVAQGSVVEDGDGERQATLLFPAGTTAEITLPDGSKRQLSQLDVRATEYTVGGNGPEAMPAQLPPSSAYTYAVELSVDQALEQGVKVAGKDVVFDRPVPFYVDNFLDFPTGEAVPAGYYDNDKAAWMPHANGRVIEILHEDSGLAVLDVTGDGNPATAGELDELGITDAERARLAGLYEPGASLWRVAVSHLSTWDCNWPYGPPEDAEKPTVPKPEVITEDHPENSDEENECPGCTISPQQQSMGESIAIAGTPFSLHYQSNRAEGYDRSSVDIPLTGDQIPTSLGSVELEIEIAGQRIAKAFTPATNLSHRFTWDGLDGYGRKVHGSATATATIRYRYPCEYRPGDNGFGEFGNSVQAIGSRNDCEGFVFTRRSAVSLTSPFNHAATVIGGWSLSVHHALSAKAAILFRGNGTQRGISGNGTIQTVAGNGFSPFGGSSGDGGPATEAPLDIPDSVSVFPDGDLYISDSREAKVRRVDSGGIITTVAGADITRGFGDGGPAKEAALNWPSDVAVAPDGSWYIADQFNYRIRKVSPEGIITTFAGTGDAGYAGDGGLATEAQLWDPTDVEVDSSGNVFIADTTNNVVRRVDTAGIITTVAGTGEVGFGGDGGLATDAKLFRPSAIAISTDGTLYISDRRNYRIRQVTPDGTISTVAGVGDKGFSGDGGQAIDARLGEVTDIAFGIDDSLYLTDNNRIRRIGTSGIITTVAGTGAEGFAGDDGPASEALFDSPSGIDVAPDGKIYIADWPNRRIRRISGLARNDDGSIAIPSVDGTKQLVFDSAGRHLSTGNTKTGEVLLSFGFDTAQRMISITDADGNVTTIERDGNGQPTAIVAPDGQRTELTVDGNDHLTQVVDPTGATWAMAYTTDGLLTNITHPNGQTNTFAYNAAGRLIRDLDPEGGGWQLVRTDLENGYRVDMTSGEGRLHRFTTLRPDGFTRLYLDEAPDGTMTTRHHTDTGTTTERPDGTTLFTKESPDPRFKMAAPLIEERRITLPSGLELLQKKDRDVSLADPEDSLSLQMLTDTVTTNGRAATASYDGGTRQWTFTSPEGRVAATEIDTLGKPLTQSIGGLKPVSTTYDPRGRPDTISQGAGDGKRSTTFDYHDASAGDQAGYLRSLTDAAGRETTFVYDAAGRVIEQMLPDERTIGYRYDANGNLAAVTPPGRSAHVFEYDGFDQRSVYQPPELTGIDSITRYRYNLDRQLTSIERPGGETVTFDYDAGGRLTARSMEAGTTSYAYEAATGRIDSIAAPGNIDLNLEWDGFLPIQSTWSGPVDGTVARTYDNNLWLTAEAVNNDNIGFAYDNDGLLTRAGDMTVTRNPDHGLVTATALDTVAGNRGYNDFGELNGRDVTLAGETVYDVTYERDRLGRIVAETETIGETTRTWSYLYDQAGRLIQVTLDGAAAYSYSYDANGNRIGYTGPDGNVTGNYDAQDRIRSYGNATYTHTAAGELASKTTPAGTTAYDYDAAGNLRKVQLPNGTVIEYLIDGRDRRIGKKVDGQLVKGWLYSDRLNPIAELDGNGNVEARFIYGDKPNVPAYMIKDDKTYRIISDHLGSVRLVIDTETGEIAQRIDYTPFGHITQNTNPGFQPFTFAGGLHDPDTNLIRFGARDYDPDIGRWTAKDPILFAGRDPNLYGYVLADPVNLLDPNGNFGVIGAAIGIATSVGVTLSQGQTDFQSIAMAAATGAASGFFTGGILNPATLRSATFAGSLISGTANTINQFSNIALDDCKGIHDFNFGSLGASLAGGAITGRLGFNAKEGFRAQQIDRSLQSAIELSTGIVTFGPNAAMTAVGTELGK